jgi:hypothetical protein
MDLGAAQQRTATVSEIAEAGHETPYVLRRELEASRDGIVREALRRAREDNAAPWRGDVRPDRFPGNPVRLAAHDRRVIGAESGHEVPLILGRGERGAGLVMTGDESVERLGGEQRDLHGEQRDDLWRGRNALPARPSPV